MTIGRRQWMAGGAALGATLAAGPLMAKSLKSKPIGIQLYTVRELFAKDPMGTLEQVAAIGYREVEYGGGGYDKMDHAALRKTMERLGLTSPSIHVGYEALASDFDGAVAMTKALGADTLIVPYMGEAHRSAESWKAAVADFNRYAERLKKAGLGFAYHNHDFEFTLKPGGTSLFDTLIADADPALVQIELDLFWAVAAGEDSKAIIRRLAGRIYAYHVKDRTAEGKMTSVGKGVIDFADIFTLNAVAGVKHFYVENDQSPAPYLPDITASFSALSRLRA
ncbi:sugar phosphate isomerase/epimerase [Sphingopyxis sp. SE2]|jgi:sugar phosphate isomerase/epimerase|uniref:sugar phosphate isomerase/epimerase family protein n=1 Tax=unclassified Sphingopyxis TaxID=2614943 RepID=UPI00050F0441|nr:MULTISPECIES: sugar phosphate isomerase/epimerase [unclassified Sphingopyxis]KGB57888.1 Xylose isomerase-like TIM barrel domain-containing protein [Sphingopyxis sp. LC363]MDT7530802.1 sugar phosphate isomerase/epimerase [Sphingopyxis sp. SE2]